MKFNCIIGVAAMAAVIIASACTGGKKVSEGEAYDKFVTVKDGELTQLPSPSYGARYADA